MTASPASIGFSARTSTGYIVPSSRTTEPAFTRASGCSQECLDDYAVVIAEDPNHAEHYLERGNVLRRIGRFDDAFADYERAIRLSPPFPEIYYNRADLRALTGDIEGALADFSYVIELEPDFVDAYANRAALYLENGDLDRAGADAEGWTGPRW